MINRYRKGCPERGGVGLNHHRQFQPTGNVGKDRHADLPSAVRDHEVHRLRAGMFGSANKVALVFPILCIDNDYDLTCLKGFDGGINRAEIRLHRVLSDGF